jgi:hypothetical protein
MSRIDQKLTDVERLSEVKPPALCAAAIDIPVAVWDKCSAAQLASLVAKIARSWQQVLEVGRLPS